MKLGLKEEYRLIVFKNMVLRRIFAAEGVEVAGTWRKLQNDELHNLYFSPNINSMIKSRKL
jgi:hypothetical protein